MLPSSVVLIIIVAVAVTASTKASAPLLATMAMSSSLISVPGTVWAQEAFDLVLGFIDIAAQSASGRRVSRTRRVTVTSGAFTLVPMTLETSQQLLD